jgi:Holliday junction resolvase RusA-like endonuclease
MTPILHVTIPNYKLPAWERVGWSAGRARDVQKEAKRTFQWQIRAAASGLKVSTGRLGVILEVWILANGKRSGDADNFFKFVGDAGQGMIWEDDGQIDDARVIVHRGALAPRVELLVWELP